MARPEIIAEDLVPSGQTVEFYDTNAESYVEATRSNALSSLHPELLSRIPMGGLVLDAGCGSRRDILAFVERGFQVGAFDASAPLARLATQRRTTGTSKLQFRFPPIIGPSGVNGGSPEAD